MLQLICLQDGNSNYFKGLMLILSYLIVAASFFVHVDPSEIGQFKIKASTFHAEISSLYEYLYKKTYLMYLFMQMRRIKQKHSQRTY